jgi:mannose-6-phosphate isomerase
VVDRPEAQSVMSEGTHAGTTLHSLWKDHRTAVFGEAAMESERFPLLIKLLDDESFPV